MKKHLKEKLNKAEKYFVENIIDLEFFEVNEEEEEHILLWGYESDCSDYYNVVPNSYSIGYKPKYQGESGIIFVVDKEIEKSGYYSFYSFGNLGSKCVKRYKAYSSFVKKSKYKKAIEDLHRILYI